MCTADYKSILKIAGSKLRLGKKVLGRARLVVEATGVELRPDDPNLQKEIINGSVIIVYTSARDEKRPPAETSDDPESSKHNSIIDVDLDPPPLAPSHCKRSEYDEPSKDAAKYVTQQLAAATTREEEESTEMKNKIARESVHNDLLFNGCFPILEGNVLPLVQECITGSKCFTETDFGDYVAFDYKDASSAIAFPNPWQPGQRRKSKERWLLALRRECRGLILCSHTGKVLRRPFHKFFNIGEVEETAEDRVELIDDIMLLEKVDGSLVSPLILTGSSEIQWATRKSLQPDLKAFCQNAVEDYEGLARYCIDDGKTPLFEWCVAGQAVGVVRHHETSVVLLSIRDMVTGAYLPRHRAESICLQFGVPCVKPLTSVNITSQTQSIPSMHDLVAQIAVQPAPLEGAVVVLKGGQNLYKIKTHWYVSMASASKKAGPDRWAFLHEFLNCRPSLEGIPREKLWKACLSDTSGNDDSRATCLGLIKERDQADQLQRFIELCDEAVDSTHSQLCKWSSRFRNRIANQKECVDLEATISALSESCGWSRKVIRAYISDTNVTTSFLRQDLMQKEVEDIENAFGFRWNETNSYVEYLETSEAAISAVAKENHAEITEEQKNDADDGERYILRSDLFQNDSLDIPPKGIEDHVCSAYLLRKIANYLGRSKSSIMDETLIEIESNYKCSEGKLKGMWESFVKKKIVDLRIDLQPPLGNISDHNGTSDWALWLVQYGPNKVSKNTSKVRDGYASGNFAGVFVQTNRVHRYSDLLAAMRSSFKDCRLVFLTSREGISRVPGLTQEDRMRYKHQVAGGGNNLGTNNDVFSEKVPWTLFIDLDGVLADFDGALLDASGKRSSDFTNATAMWRYIMSSERIFFAHLPWTEHGRKLWAFLQRAGQMEGIGDVKILTGVPNTKSGGKSVIRQKVLWCNERLGTDTEVITCLSNEKHKWGGQKCILIDDHLLHREKWEETGGTFVHYTGNFAHLERLLRTLVFPYGGLSTEELEAISSIRDRAALQLEQAESLYLDESHIHYVKGSDGSNDDLFSRMVGSLSNDAVGIDCEWRPDELSKRSGKLFAASVIQVSFRGSVFVIDTQEISPISRRTLVSLFSPETNTDCHLIFFGGDEDLNRIVAAVPEIVSFHNAQTACLVIDLQRVFETLGLNRCGKNLISLSEMTAQVAGYSLTKDRSVQASDWSKRPLSSAQIQYAACDAYICNVLWEAIAQEECLRVAVLTSMAEPVKMPSSSYLQRYTRTATNQTCSQNEAQSDEINLANPAPVLSAPPSGPVHPSYAAVFLSKESAQKLLEAHPPQHRNVLADHVTLTYAPKSAALAGIPIGTRCHIRVSEVLHDDKSQVARVFLENDCAGVARFSNSLQNLHITMSTAVNVPASRSPELLHLPHRKVCDIDHPGEEPNVIVESARDMILDGFVGVFVQLTEKQNRLASLNKSVLGKLTEFAECKAPGSTLKFRGGMLNPTERAAIHAFCEDNGIISRSEGPKSNRKLTLSFPKFLHESEKEITGVSNTGRIVQSALDLDDERKHKQSKKLRARDARNIASDYICLSMDVFTLIEWKDGAGNPSFVSPIGELCFDVSSEGYPEIHIDPERQVVIDSGSDEALLTSLILSGKLPKEVPKPVVIIMRGLPGSGKSSWARVLQQHCDSEQGVAIVSADDFFEAKGSYEENFEQSKLGDAHEFCRKRFIQELADEDRGAVIVDNTNSTLAEYQVYINIARTSGKRYLVVEMLCRSEDELQEFYHRGVHQVPMQAMGRMRARWENNDNTLSFISVNRANTGGHISSATLPKTESCKDT